MNVIQKTITVNVPAHTLFAYIAAPANLMKLCPYLRAIDDIQQLSNGGVSFQWEYKMADVRFVGSSRVTEYVPNQRFTSSIQGGITGQVTWMLAPQPDGTQVTLIIEYETPLPLLYKHDEGILIRENETAVSSLLQALKTTQILEQHDSDSSI